MATKKKYKAFDEGFSIDGITPTAGPGLPPITSIEEPVVEPEPDPPLSSFGMLNYHQFHSTYGGNYDSYEDYLATGILPDLPAVETEEVEEEAPTEETVEETIPCDAEGVPCSVSGEPPVSIEPMEVTPAPAYEISPEQAAFEEMYSGQLTDWVEAGGYGIPQETQNLMIQQQTDILKAREQESLRVMRNNMERRGLTNSGLIFANEQAIRSNTSKAIAGAIADVQIKSALMKLASFEVAMGQAGQFLNYLSTQSQLAYQPEFATWQAEQMATLQAWQAQLDLLKMEINQAYQTQNIQLQSQLQCQLAAQQHQYNLELAEMEIEANQQAAAAQGAGSIFGTILGFIFGK